MAALRWCLVPLTAALVALVAACGGGSDSEAATTTTTIGAFPMPGTPTASPQTQISLRGAPAADLGTITVTGSQTGEHSGQLKEHSDGKGGSFVLDEPLKGGETVKVETDLTISGTKDGDYRFKTVARPASGLQSGAPPNPKLLQALVGQKGTPPKGVAITYRSRPDLRPPLIQVNKRASKTVAPGYVFIAPKKVFGGKPRKGLQAGPMIVDNTGEPVWFAQNDAGHVTDFRIQQYQGKPVMTWWQGRAVLGTGEGVVQIVDPSFERVKTVQGGNGYKLDFHEARITPQGTLLGIVYNPVAWDLSSVGGAKRARVVDAVVQEIDIETGLVLFEWHSLGTISLKEGVGEVPKGSKALYDYVHPNSVGLTPQGDILLSGREVWAAYELERGTGRLLARIGGKKSDYKLSKAAVYAWQHDIQMHDDGTLHVFDNESAPKIRDQSRGLILTLDRKRKTVDLRRAFVHRPDKILAGTQGNLQTLPNGNFFIGWGSQGYFSEFTKDGRLLWDARIERGEDTYRAYRFPFTATPKTDPAVAMKGRDVYASYNGATKLASWDVLAGDSADALKKVASGRKTGFETRIRLKAAARFVAVQAKEADGTVIGTSKPVKAGA
jgi:hypothetical protein